MDEQGGPTPAERRWPSRLCSLQITSPSHSVQMTCVALSRVNAGKAAGLDGVRRCVLRAYAMQLTEVWTDIFNLSLAQAAVHMCFKTTSIISVPKYSTVMGLNDCEKVLQEAGPGSPQNQSTTNTPTNSPTTRTGVQKMPSLRCFTPPSPISTTVTPVSQVLIVDYRKSNDGTHTPIDINGTEVERNTSSKFLVSTYLWTSLGTSTPPP